MGKISIRNFIDIFQNYGFKVEENLVFSAHAVFLTVRKASQDINYMIGFQLINKFVGSILNTPENVFIFGCFKKVEGLSKSGGVISI